MSSIGERIIYLRERFNLSQEDLGNLIGVSRFTISNYEAERRNVTERALKDICRVLNVSYDWLKEGTGDMIDKTDDELIGLVDRILGDDIPDTAKSVFRAFAKLDNDDWELLGKIIDDIAAERAKK